MQKCPSTEKNAITQSPQPTPLLYTFSSRITPNQFEDRLNPLVLSIFDDKKKFPFVLIFREFAKDVKLHYHLYFKSTLKESAIRYKIKKFYSHNRAYQLHPIAIGEKIICTNPKHAKPNCLVSAGTYCAKEGDVIYRQGFSPLQEKKFIEVGAKILSFVKQKLHKKIIQKYKISCKTDSKTIVRAYLSYRREQGHAGFPANKYVVQSVLNDILQEISPGFVDYLISEYTTFLDDQRSSASHLHRRYYDDGINPFDDDDEPDIPITHYIKPSQEPVVI